MAADLDGVPLTMPTSERARALIAWLALHPGSHARSLVATALWPDVAQDRALANLRTAIWAAHQAWGPAGERVLATRSGVSLSAEDLWLDVGDDADPERGEELLPGLNDEWVVRARDEGRAERVRRLVELADRAERDDDLAEAVRLSRRVCELQPLDEGAHRALVRRLLGSGERATALVIAREFSDRLRDELGVRPSAATRAVHASVRAGNVAADRPRLFGRSPEVARLNALWRDAADGHGQVVVLSGEAGIGKTTVLGELAHRVTGGGGRVALAVGLDVAGETPFAAWLDLAKGIVATVPRAPVNASWPSELNRLSPLLGGRLGHRQQPPAATAPELERLRVFEAMLRLVEWSCADRPTLLAIDDAHRADRASLRLAAHVGRRMGDLPVLLVLTRRTGIRSPELDGLLADLRARSVPVNELDLSPITDAEVAALACSLHSLDDLRVRDVVAAAEGNPLLAVETTRSLVAGDTGPPANLRTAVRASMGRLSESAAGLVQLLAVAARPLHRDELHRLGVTDAAAHEAVVFSEGLLVQREGRIGFRHELLRAAVHADLSDSTGMHDRLADALDPAELVEIAHHLSSAGRRREAARTWAEAAARARSVGAVAEAADLLTRAVDHAPDDGRLWLELEEALAWQRRRPEMDAAWDTALRLLPAAELAEAWCRRGLQFRTVACHPETSLRAYRTAEELLAPDAPPALRARTLIGRAWGDAVAGAGSEFETLLATARDLVPEPDPGVAADIVEIQMQGLIRQGRFADAVAVVRASGLDAPMAGSPDRAFAVWLNAACALVCTGDLEGALAMADGAATATRDIEGLLVACLAARAQILARLGRHEEAREAAHRQQECADRLDAPVLSATAAHDSGLVALAAGRFAEAAELLSRGLSEGAEVSRVSAGLFRAEALARAGDVRGATDQLRAALLEPVGRADQPWSLVPRVAWVQALIAAADDDWATVRRRLDEAEGAWQRVASRAGESDGEGFLASLVDLGRPPVIGLIEPQRGLDRIAELRQSIPSETTAR
ncbi:MAG: transcriptional activator domain [Nocardioides sp.]|nr:transcriptional activator domain [Nocardioides sp.]